MRIFIALLWFCWLPICLQGQIGTNPFEIQSRLDSVYKSPAPTESSEKNIFDIEREGSTNDALIVSPSIPTVLPTDSDTLEVESTLTPSVGEDTEEDLRNQQDENPFDVSHIPIRKSQLKNEANAFTKKKTGAKKGQSSSNTFLFWLMLFTFLLLSVVINTKRNAILNIAKSITNENVLKLNYREENQGLNGQYLLLYLCFIINISIFGYLIVKNFSNQGGWSVYLMCLLAVSIGYFIRHMFLGMAARIFPIYKEVSLYGFTIQIFNIFLGMVLIPFNLIIAFNGPSIALPILYFAIAVVAIIYLIRLFRGLLIASPFIQSNLFHFLLYLCAFEILPILVIIKAIGNMN